MCKNSLEIQPEYGERIIPRKHISPFGFEVETGKCCYNDVSSEDVLNLNQDALKKIYENTIKGEIKQRIKKERRIRIVEQTLKSAKAIIDSFKNTPPGSNSKHKLKYNRHKKHKTNKL